MSIDLCRLIDLQTICEKRGSLTVIEAGSHVPFEIGSVFYIYGVPEGSKRGGHAHRDLQELVVAVAGSCDVSLDDGLETRQLRLSDPSQGLYIYPSVWRELRDFAAGTVLLVLASRAYDEADYIRDYSAFRNASIQQTYSEG